VKKDISLAIIKSITDSQKDLIIIFQNDEPLLINDAFERFFSVSSLDEYKESYGSFVESFVLHPSYFNAEKIAKGESWVDAILKLPEMDRIVSMMTPNYEPHAFSVHVEKIEEYIIAVFTDITQPLIKRIMIENNTSIDKESGAYAKNYFLHMLKSYQDAVAFNKKIVSAILIKTAKTDESALSELVGFIKSKIRQDDMLIRWTRDTFLLMSLVDNVANAQKMAEKLDIDECTLTLTMQNENESIRELIKRIEN
jgi:hypothetical protein